MSSTSTRSGPWPRGFSLRAGAFVVAGILPASTAVASAPGRPSTQGLVLYAATTGLFLLAVPVLAAFGTVTGLARGALAAVLPRLRLGSGVEGRTAARLRTAAGVFRGPRGLGGLLDDLRNRLARRGPPAVVGGHAI
jgi:hypothetical protein